MLSYVDQTVVNQYGNWLTTLGVQIHYASAGYVRLASTVPISRIILYSLGYVCSFRKIKADRLA